MTRILPVNKEPQAVQEGPASPLLVLAAAAAGAIALGILAALLKPAANISTRDFATSVSSSSTSSIPLSIQSMHVGTERIRPIPIGTERIRPIERQVGTERIRTYTNFKSKVKL